MDDVESRSGRKRTISRRRFLAIGGAGVVGAALTGMAGCGGASQSGGVTKLVFSSSVDDTGIARKLVDKFNEQNKGNIHVQIHLGSADTGQRFDQIRTQFEAGGEDLDVILAAYRSGESHTPVPIEGKKRWMG